MIATLLLLAPASAAPNARLTVEVIGVDGAPIPAAVVRFPAEGREAHRVNHVDATWTGQALYTVDGAQPFAIGDTVTVTVDSPGYWTRQVPAHLKRRNNRVSVVLEAMPLATRSTALSEAPYQQRARRARRRLRCARVGRGRARVRRQRHDSARAVSRHRARRLPDPIGRRIANRRRRR
jgi:hypothetical protein